MEEGRGRVGFKGGKGGVVLGGEGVWTYMGGRGTAAREVEKREHK